MTRIQEVINSKVFTSLRVFLDKENPLFCYRYLIDTYPETVFCVRSITNEGQAQNLVTALDGLGKHNSNLIIYSDVQPGETLWAFCCKELQARGLSILFLFLFEMKIITLTQLVERQSNMGLQS